MLTTILPLLAFAVLTAGNAFFVAAEFSLVTVDRTEVSYAAEQGDRTARRIRAALGELSVQLSGAQLGITITALLTGYLVEPALAHLLSPMLAPLGAAGRGLSYLLALVIATVVSMLFGELMPKNLAIAQPMRTARRTVVLMQRFVRLFGWLIRGLSDSADRVVRALGVTPAQTLASMRPEELGELAVLSAEAGAMSAETALLLRRTISFGNKRAAEAMTPRVNVVGIAATTCVQDVLVKVRSSGRSRFPVYGETLDDVVGVITVIDALAVEPRRRWYTTAREAAREPVAVPGTLRLDGVLAVLAEAGQDLAIVIDEYGGMDGVVTIEDLVEELVGEIDDEYDEVPASAPDRREAPDWRTEAVDGVLRGDELEELTGFRLPVGPYETLAGFVLDRLGHIPGTGERVVERGWHFTVVAVARHRITKVRVEAPADRPQVQR